VLKETEKKGATEVLLRINYTDQGRVEVKKRLPPPITLTRTLTIDLTVVIKTSFP